MRTQFSVLACACVVLFTAPGPVALAAPAADRADLTVRLSGTALTNAARTQVATATVTNRGPSVARGVRLRFAGQVDSEAVEPRSIRFCPDPGADESPPPTVIPSLVVPFGGGCALPDLPPGRSLELTTTVVRLAVATGVVGQLTVLVSHAGIDPVADNAATAAFTFPAASEPPVPGRPALYARAWDGPVDADGRLAAVAPGGTGDLRFEIGNRGARQVDGFTITIRLPRQVTFAENRAGCAYDAGRQTATCGYQPLSLVPAARDVDPYDRVFSALRLRYAVRVSPAAPAPATLTGGRLSVVPVAVARNAGAGQTARAVRPAGGLPVRSDGSPVATLPGEATGLRAVAFASAGGSDDFAVSTTPAVADDAGGDGSGGDGSGGAHGDAGGDGSGGADGDAAGDGSGGLPATGIRGGPLGGLGLLGVVTGGALYLLARRRRVMLAAPDRHLTGRRRR